MYVIGNWPGGDADRRKMMTDLVDDQVDVTGRAFLGVTLACARCHDHKFDPISQKDYYALAGIFFSSHFLPNPGSPASGVGMIRIPLASAPVVERRKQYESKLAAMQKEFDQFRDAKYSAVARGFLPQTDRYLAASWQFFRENSARSKPDAVSIERLALGRDLDPYLLARWIEYLRPSWTAAPARRLLTRAKPSINSIAGVDGWEGADGRPCPNVIVNSTASTVTLSTLTLPPRTLAMHPGPTTGVAVGWTSPISGTIAVSGKLADADPNCGNGIAWQLDRAREKSTEALASGSFENGGTQSISDGQNASRLQRIDVNAGDVLQLTVFPKGDYTCDTTIVELEISELDGAKRTWNLLRDVVPDALAGGKGNPHADAYGNAGVWMFFEAGEEGAAAPGSLLQSWVKEASHSSDETQILSRAASVRDALVAYDASLPAKPQPTDPQARLYQDLTSAAGPFWAPARNALSHLPDDVKASVKKMADDLAALKKDAPPPLDLAHGLIEGGIPKSEYEGMHDVPIMARGRYDRPGEIVARGFPRLFTDDSSQPSISQGSGRLELARWIASPTNPMTAKVMVNRIWEHHFGQGIVRTPNNYGKLGVPPTHPELLDWLARRFVESGWSIKAMHRMMMLSATYQQSSTTDSATFKADPDNLLFSRMNRQRLEAEPLRDALLAVSGKLDSTAAGPAFRDLNIPRRTLYLMTIRSDRSNYRMLFDAADPTGIVDRRIDSTVAPQALFLMNDPFAIQCAANVASRVLSEGGADDRSRIDWLYRLLYSRPAREDEYRIGIDALERARSQQMRDRAPPSTEMLWQQYCQVLLCANEFIYID